MLSPDTIQEIESILGVTFKHKEILCEAFVHKSVDTNSQDGLKGNVHLSYFGDAIMLAVLREYVISDQIHQWPKYNDLATQLLTNETISRVVRAYELEKYLVIDSRFNHYSDNKPKVHRLATIWEAIVGAIAIDQGYDAARQFVRLQFIPLIPQLLDRPDMEGTNNGMKSIVKKLYGKHPTITVREYFNDRCTVIASVGGTISAIGNGSTQEIATFEALKRLLVLVRSRTRQHNQSYEQQKAAT